MAESDRNPTKLTVEGLAAVLSTVAGTKIPADWVMADMKAGAPKNEDGTINLLHYTAWLVKESGRERRS